MANFTNLTVLLLLLGVAVEVFPTAPLSSYEVVFGWKKIDFNFTTPQTRERLIQTKEFIPENNIIVGVKIWKDRVFLTVPRWRPGIPSTMNFVYLADSKKDGGEVEGPSPPLNPYPSWAMQQIGNCDVFQFTQSMEIDEYGRMWVIDTGRVNIFAGPELVQNNCPAKIMIIDLETDEVVKKYEFPADVVSPASNFLNDIVVGCKDKNNCWAYMTDATDTKLVVYNLKEDKSWYVHHHTMNLDPNATHVVIAGGNTTFRAGIDGIALSPKDEGHDKVFYTPLAGYGLYQVSAKLLQESVNGATLKDQDVKVVNPRRPGNNDGLGMDSQGLLFYGVAQNHSVVFVNTSEAGANSTPPKEVLLITNEVDLQWVDAFGFDDKGYIYLTTNRIHRYQSNTMDWNEVNYRVCRVFTGARSYIYSAKDDEVSGSVTEQDSPSHDYSPTNLDKDAPDEPAGARGRDIRKKDSDIYKHDDADGNSGWGRSGNDDGSNDAHNHHRSDSQQGYPSEGDGETGASTTTSSAPLANEQLPVVLFLSVLMYNPALLVDNQ